MDFVFTSVKIEGFQSIGNPCTLELCEQGLVLIRGVNEYESFVSSNGSGKSSLMESVCWCIYGRTSAGVTDPTNRYYSDGCSVDVKFRIDSAEYEIIRSIKHRENKTGLVFMLNGADISARNKTETDKFIQSHMKIGMELFLSAIFLSQGFNGRLSAMSPSTRKECLENITDTAARLDEFSKKVTDQKTKHSTEYSELATKLSYEKGVYATLKRQVEEIEARVSDEPGEEIDYESIVTDIDHINTAIGIISDRKSDNIKFVSEKMSEISSIEQSITMCQSMITETERCMSFLDSKGSEECPTCHQKIVSEETVKSLQEEYTEKIKKAKSDIVIYDDQLRTAKDGLKELHGVSELIRNKEDKLRRMLKDKQELQIKYSKTKSISDEKEKLISLGDKMSESEDRIQKYTDSVKDVSEKQEILSSSLQYISRQFRNYLLSETIEFVNGLLKLYSSALFSNTGDTINMVSDSSKLDLYLSDRSYDTLSGGEKRRIDIAVALVQRDLGLTVSGFSCNLLVLDESLESLDESASSAVLEMVTSMSDKIESIFVISHNNYCIPSDKIVTVTKRADQISTVTIE